jgi:hypothetical protein
MIVETTRLLNTKTTRLRSWLRHTDPYMLIAGLVFALIVLGSSGHSWWLAHTAPPAPIIIVATATPLRGAGATQALKLLTRLAAAPTIPTAVPAPTAPPDAPLAVRYAAPDAAPTELPAPTPAAMPTQPLTIVYTNPDGSVFARYRCQPYGDWRDADPLYAHPECAPSPTPVQQP